MRRRAGAGSIASAPNLERDEAPAQSTTMRDLDRAIELSALPQMVVASGITGDVVDLRYRKVGTAPR